MHRVLFDERMPCLRQKEYGEATDLPHMSESDEINDISRTRTRRGPVELQVQVRDKQPAAGLAPWRGSFHDAGIDRFASGFSRLSRRSRSRGG